MSLMPSPSIWGGGSYGGGGGSPSFGLILTDSGTYPAASSPTDTLALTSSDGSIGISGNAVTDTVDFTVNPNLVLTSLKLKSTTHELLAQWDGSTTFTVETTDHLSLIAGSSLTLTSTTGGVTVNSFGGGITLSELSVGSYLSLDGIGTVLMASSSSGSFSMRSYNAWENFFGSVSGDYRVNNELYGDVFVLANDGSTTLRAFNTMPIKLETANGQRTHVTNGIDIYDEAPSLQASVIALTGSNFGFGTNNFAIFAGSGTNNIAIGQNIYEQGNDGAANIGIGNDVMRNGTLSSTATGNIGIGVACLQALTNGEGNIAVGTHALANNNDGDANLAIGYLTLRNNTTASGNLAIGSSAGYSTTTGANNTFIGPSAGVMNTTGTGNLYIGESAAAQVNGNGNIAIGAGSMSGASGSQASGNVVIGLNLLPSIDTGGNYNIVIGNGAGGAGVITTGEKNLIIGYGSDVPTGTSDNQMSIGNAIYGLGISSGTGTTLSTAQIGIMVKAPTAHLDLKGSTTGNASLRIRSGSAPTSPNSGDIWFDGTDLKMRVGGTTKTFTLV